ncbi:hypothetical protein BHE90_005720 [Fusarium euwallaceae]|uniref:Uncharacterized protein n=1 Tax=Fusarium euwallaceae TaxID=1147111 RepID=A0A430LVN9_9HYPO|nr:hypothetical protein BHE90_005720 [Fusarium euwallaceae]
MRPSPRASTTLLPLSHGSSYGLYRRRDWLAGSGYPEPRCCVKESQLSHASGGKKTPCFAHPLASHILIDSSSGIAHDVSLSSPHVGFILAADSPSTCNTKPASQADGHFCFCLLSTPFQPVILHLRM